MTPHEFEAALRGTLADRRLSRKERRGLADALGTAGLDFQALAVYRDVAFRVAREAAGGDSAAGAADVIDWLADVNNLLLPAADGREEVVCEAYFSPGDRCQARILDLLESARERIDLCVYAFTDDRITAGVLAAHARAVPVRVISDCTKCEDPGADVHALADAGVPVKVNGVDGLMHHKFAVFDGRRVLTGSYNWTRSAAVENFENIIVSHDARLAGRFAGEFERMWAML